MLFEATTTPSVTFSIEATRLRMMDNCIFYWFQKAHMYLRFDIGMFHIQDFATLHNMLQYNPQLPHYDFQDTQ